MCGVHAVAGHRVGHQRGPGRGAHLAALLPVNPRQPEQQQQEEGGAVHGDGGSAPHLLRGHHRDQPWQRYRGSMYVYEESTSLVMM